MRSELIIYWSRADECLVVEVPELPGCMADGATDQEANAHTVGWANCRDRISARTRSPRLFK